MVIKRTKYNLHLISNFIDIELIVVTSWHNKSIKISPTEFNNERLNSIV